MDPESILAGTASLFMALGDKTRLRLLNLMRDREICVSSFTGILGQSQPLISRHLAYLRNSGLVEARRDGKWMHYSVSAQLDDNTRRLLQELFKWMELQEGLRLDRTRYSAMAGEIAEEPVTPEPRSTSKPRRQRSRSMATISAPPEPEPGPELEIEEYAPVRHNELEDFLL